MAERRTSCMIHVALGVCLITALAGCNGHKAAAAGHALMVVIPAQRAVALFAVDASGDAPPGGMIREAAPDVPVDAQSDMQLRIFVANANDNIAVYVGRNFDYQLEHTIAGAHTQLGQIHAIAVDPGGDIYVAEGGDATHPPQVEWFAAGLSGDVPPARVLAGPHTGITSPSGIAIDASGRAYVANTDSDRVLVFDPEARGDTAPIATIGPVKSPSRVFVDQDLNVYVSSSKRNTIDAYFIAGPQNWTHSGTITSAELRAPGGMTASPDGELLAAARGGVLLFPAGAKGMVQPVRELRGPWLMNPVAAALR